MQADKIPDEIMRVAHGLYADAQQRHNVTDIARALITRDTAARIECAEIAKQAADEATNPSRACQADEIAAAIEATMGGRDAG